MTAKRSMFATASLVAMVVLALVGARADTASGCPLEGDPVALRELAGSLSSDAVVAASNGILRGIDEQGRSLLAPTGAPGPVRHVARSGGNLSYVVDLPGPDRIVVIRDGDASTMEPGGEVAHPAWSPDGRLAYSVDLARIEVVQTGGATISIGKPAGTLGVFSPVFDAAGHLFAVAEESVSGSTAHDGALDNVYSYIGGTWSRVTSFAADAEKWSVIRTPVADGQRILFVREFAEAQATRQPRSELWELGAEGPRLVRTLDGEAFLAAVGDPGILWNVERDGEWRLVFESPGGLFDLGCGGVMVDPRSEWDPDMAPEIEAGSMELSSPDKDDVPSVEIGEDMGIVVGDFYNRAEAEVWAGIIDAAARVVDTSSAPFAVAPGVYAVAIPVAPTSDGLSELDALRARFPELEERSWISYIGGAES
ncbi:MAG TPA: hypothetical protein VEA19_06790 [Actinomycetota bacterium]|nr:hypothetical protein [Actinomycetota bacterium]